MRENYKIYCDMDGVLTDFNSQFESLSGNIPSKEYESYNFLSTLIVTGKLF